jgi:hypothetical protein
MAITGTASLSGRRPRERLENLSPISRVLVAGRWRSKRGAFECK